MVVLCPSSRSTDFYNPFDRRDSEIPVEESLAYDRPEGDEKRQRVV